MVLVLVLLLVLLVLLLLVQVLLLVLLLVVLRLVLLVRRQSVTQTRIVGLLKCRVPWCLHLTVAQKKPCRPPAHNAQVSAAHRSRRTGLGAGRAYAPIFV